MPVKTNPRTIEALEGTLEELCTPDLTLGRASVLRRRMAQLLEALNGGNEGSGDLPGPKAEACI